VSDHHKINPHELASLGFYLMVTRPSERTQPSASRPAHCFGNLCAFGAVDPTQWQIGATLVHVGHAYACARRPTSDCSDGSRGVSSSLQVTPPWLKGHRAEQMGTLDAHSRRLIRCFLKSLK